MDPRTERDNLLKNVRALAAKADALRRDFTGAEQAKMRRTSTG
ncbi:hypothetical protein [Crystallibacter degradans]|nr:hypothetical protein [Arthrobacter sp. SF27]